MSKESEQSGRDLTIKQYSVKKGYSERHVRRLIKQGKINGYQLSDRGMWFIPENHKAVEQGFKNPVGVLCDEAYARCKNGDHTWFDDSHFNGLAYRCEPSYEVGYLGIEARHFTKTCYFCGYSRSELIF
jgi:hypothetical protein